MLPPRPSIAEIARRETLREARRRAFEGRSEALRDEFTAKDAELALSVEEARNRREKVGRSRIEMARARQAFAGRRDGKARDHPRGEGK